MLGIHIEMTGDFDIDSFEVEIECPRCSFVNPMWIKQARVRDVIICRGCKSNIQLDDGMNSVRKARQDVRRAFDSLRRQLDQFNRSFG